MPYLSKVAELTGKTVRSVESIRAEYGRTYDSYYCVTCEDGSRVFLTGGVAYDPKPPLAEMRRAPFFFTPEEIAARVLAEEVAARRRKAEDYRRKSQEIVRLQRELGDPPPDVEPPGVVKPRMPAVAAAAPVDDCEDDE